MERLSNKEFNEIWRKKTKEFILLRSYVLTFLRSYGLITNH
jgi:hypothetical protein